jgi:hypothetical protein
MNLQGKVACNLRKLLREDEPPDKHYEISGHVTCIEQSQNIHGVSVKNMKKRACLGNQHADREIILK